MKIAIHCKDTYELGYCFITEFLKTSTVKTGLNVFFIFQLKDMFRLWLSFHEIQSILASFNMHIVYNRAVLGGSTGGVSPPSLRPPSPFSGAKMFFPHKIGKHNILICE